MLLSQETLCKEECHLNGLRVVQVFPVEDRNKDIPEGQNLLLCEDIANVYWFFRNLWLGTICLDCSEKFGVNETWIREA